MRRTAGSLLIIIALMLLAIFAFRNKLLRYAFTRSVRHVQPEYHLKFGFSRLYFSGFNKITLEGFTVTPDSADTLLNIRKVELSISVLNTLAGHALIDALEAEDADITAYRLPERNNLGFIRNNDNQPSITNGESNYHNTANRLKQKLQQLARVPFKITNLHLSYRDTLRNEALYFPYIGYNLNTLSGCCINQNTNDTIFMGGEVITPATVFKVKLSHSCTKLCYLPFLDFGKKLKCGFDSLEVELSLKQTAEKIKAEIHSTASNFRVNHWRLANEDVEFPSAELNSRLIISAKSIELDSSSYFVLNNCRFNLFSAYTQDTGIIFSLALNMPETPADTFFNALPAAAFNAVHGISCSGTLAYNLQFQINTLRPDSLIFISQLARKNLHINHFGTENFERVNGPFLYNAYDNGKLTRQIEIGPSNPKFTYLRNISPILINCVLQAEDPSFMTHNGFLAESFRESIVQDYRQRRFVRGGSTISMQLVKNVFLSRDKTISRKAQEALVVYLIENLHLIPKERMLEIYLSVIEWGPGIYGIGEASRFYFNKTPEQLTLPESLFLASIVPNPKSFRYRFDKQGHLQPYMADYFRLIATRLNVRGLLSDEELSNLKTDVKLTGPARLMVLPGDSLPPAEDLWDDE